MHAVGVERAMVARLCIESQRRALVVARTRADLAFAFTLAGIEHLHELLERRLHALLELVEGARLRRHRLPRLTTVECIAGVAHLALGAAQRARDLAEGFAQPAHQVAQLPEALPPIGRGSRRGRMGLTV